MKGGHEGRHTRGACKRGCRGDIQGVKIQHKEFEVMCGSYVRSGDMKIFGHSSWY